MPLEVYQLSDQAKAIDAFRQLRASPTWSQWSTGPLVPTKGLRRVVKLDAHVEDHQGTLWTRLPERLPAGWYLVQYPSKKRPAQAILQVTDIASYLLVSETDTLVWANDLATGTPIADATVSVDGASLGRTGGGRHAGDCHPGSTQAGSRWSLSAGLRAGGRHRRWATIVLRPGDWCANPRRRHRHRCLLVRVRWAPTFWQLFHSDRDRYRSTDTINAWGVVRDRDTGKVPASVTIRLGSADESDGAIAPVAQITGATKPTGAFTGSLALRDVPAGAYQLELVVDGTVVGRRYVEVGRILKPAYRLDVVTGRRDLYRRRSDPGYGDGEFLRGHSGPRRPAADRRLPRRDARRPTRPGPPPSARPPVSRMTRNRRAPTTRPCPCDPLEPRRARSTARVTRSWSSRACGPSPRMRRSATDGSGCRAPSTSSIVIDSSASWPTAPRSGTWIRAARRSRSRTVTGQVHGDHPGAHAGRHDVRLHREARRAGVRVRPAGARRPGRFGSARTGAVDSAGPSRCPARTTITGSRSRSTDPDGHVARRTTYASVEHDFDEGQPSASLGLTVDQDDASAIRHRRRDRPDDARCETAAARPEDDRRLFYLAQRGLRDVTVARSPRFVTEFPAWGPPNAEIGAVRFTGTGYVDAGRFQARLPRPPTERSRSSCVRTKPATAPATR